MSVRFLKPSDAARQLGVSTKALRVYEQRGLVKPGRTAAGWRSYGPDDLAHASAIVALRAFGLSLTQVERVLNGDAQGLEPALAEHQAALEGRIAHLSGVAEQVRALRGELMAGRTPALAEVTGLMTLRSGPALAFDLPWPWGGERFVLQALAQRTFIIGPLGSGKTRLALKLAESMADAVFVAFDRASDGGVAARAQLERDPVLRARTDGALAWLVEDGATVGPDLVTLLVRLLDGAANTVVVDMVEQGLDQATQEALIAYLRRAQDLPRLFLMTRSSAILDLAAVRADEAILFCPANHSPPMLVAPYVGAPGFEAVASCLATPAVRARTAGVAVTGLAQAQQNAEGTAPIST